MDDPLERWLAAGLLDPATAKRIRQFESARGAASGRWRWPAVLALAGGGLMLKAGLLLFVAAHWDGWSPAQRLAFLLAAIILLHLGGAFATRHLPALGTTLHAVGTAALGAAVFFAGQAYHLEASWPQGFLLWALGAWVGWILLRDWTHALYAALLTPAWLVAEWVVRTEGPARVGPHAPLAGLLLLAVVYLHAATPAGRGSARTTLALTGAISLLPLAIFLRAVLNGTGSPTVGGFQVASWVLAFGLPLLLAWVLRRRAAWLSLIGALWVGLGVLLGAHPGAWAFVWGAMGSVGLAASGVYEASRLRINLGLAGFALTTVLFYFSSVSDRLGRATSLLVGGALFLGIGWALDRLRRRLLAQAGGHPE